MVAVDYADFEAADDLVVWRYMSLDRLRDLLTGHLYFAAARQFEDLFEGAITAGEQGRRLQEARRVFPDDERMQAWSAQEASRAFEDLRRMTKINCWHAMPHENAAMWERYCSTGVAVASTVGSLKRTLHEFRLKPECGAESIYVGRVRYLDYAAEDMMDRTMLGIFLHKRVEYRDENEVRALLSLRMAQEFGVPIPDSGVHVRVDLAELIDEVRLWPAATMYEVAAVSDEIRQAGVDCPVSRSTLGNAPTY